MPDGREVCDGVLHLQQTVGGIDEYECQRCGAVFARPKQTVEPQPAGDEANDPWYDR